MKHTLTADYGLTYALPMQISVIVAASLNNVIGRAQDLPWRLSADLKRFKALTLGHPILMGRLTWESIGRPLPDRQNLVITRQPDPLAAGVLSVGSLDEALALAAPADEVFVMGGARLYAEALPRADRLYLTRVQTELEGDTWLPEIDWDRWREISCEAHPADEQNEFPYHFLEYRR